MKKALAVLLLFLLAGIGYPQNALAFVHFRNLIPPLKAQTLQIADGTHQENHPAIYGNWVVYSDWGGSDVDLRLYNLQTKEDKLLVSKPEDQMNPDIWGNIVVWNEYNGTDWDVFGMNFVTKKEFFIASLLGSNQEAPAIFNHLVVWSDNRNGNYDIYSYNLITKKETQLTDETTNNHAPRIWGNKVVWYNALAGGYYSIEGYDFVTKQKFLISSVNNGFQQTPDIFNNHVVWVDSRDGSPNVYLKNLITGEEQALTSGGGASYPRISQRYVSWVDDEGIGAHNIYVSDLFFDRTTQISDDGSQPPSPTIPDIWNDTVVWMSWHTGGGDIYGARIK